MRKIDGQLVYSPSDLVVFLESPFASWMNRQYLEDPDSLAPDEDDPLLQVLAKRGDAHERQYLEQLEADGVDVCTTEGKGRFEQTVEAISSGIEVIFQARLKGDQFAGHADFLKKLPGSGQYAVWDTKLSRRNKPYFMIQLCCYADMLEQMTGVRPESIGVILGDGAEHSFRTNEFFAYYKRVKAAFLESTASYPDGEAPVPEPSANHGRWATHAQAWLEERDHLCQVANISKGQIAKLNGVGIQTMVQLAEGCPAHVKGIGGRVLARLSRQAQLQVQSHGLEKPLFDVLQPPEDNPVLGLAALPTASRLDVFFDMEGYPAADDWLDYLFGAVTTDEGKDVFHDWWAHSDQQEKRAFEDFIDWVYERWQQDPSMHIYHYAPYETTAAKRLMGKYGTREKKVDDLLRNRVFVDLYAVVRRGVLVGEPSYSIKNLEHIYMDKREGGVTDAGASVLVYDAWCESGESADWQKSDRLKAIRDYNEDDCVSTVLLANWLRECQEDAGIAWAEKDGGADEPEPERQETPEAKARRELAESILSGLPAEPPTEEIAAGNYRLTQLLAYLLEFHRRADKPMWWRLFERRAADTRELWDDMDCIAGLAGVDQGEPVKQSKLFRYEFDPDQDTKLKEGDRVALVPDQGVTAGIEEFDAKGRLGLKIGNKQLSNCEGSRLPTHTSIIPSELITSEVLRESIYQVVRRYTEQGHLQQSLEDFLAKKSPRLKSGATGQLRKRDEDLVGAAIRIALDMDDTCLCLQGPPGTGKTYTASQMIKHLLEAGHSVGISSNSHKAILNLMKAVCEIYPEFSRATKVGGDEGDPVLEQFQQIRYSNSADARHKQDAGTMIGATAWFFAHPACTGAVDYLFVDEAGQVSVANLVAMSAATKNIVLLGDQMQLGQPTEGSHPGESGQSILEYYLHGHQTIPHDRGLFLDTSWRMHPDVCTFISDAFYEGRLQPEEHTANRVVRLPADGGTLVSKEAGVLYMPVEHEGNTQGSDEEVELICRIVEELAGRMLTDDKGADLHVFDVATDILFVAPYNMQVRKLKKALPAGARVASVDKFQGQEAPIVIVSMCASPGEFGSRGMKFVLDKNRMNVAISRAQSLAVVVGDPRLAQSACGSVEEMGLLNLCCSVQDAGAVRD